MARKRTQMIARLSQAAASAYYNQSVEDDAYGAGNAVVDAFPGAGHEGPWSTSSV